MAEDNSDLESRVKVKLSAQSNAILAEVMARIGDLALRSGGRLVPVAQVAIKQRRKNLLYLLNDLPHLTDREQEVYIRLQGDMASTAAGVSQSDELHMIYTKFPSDVREMVARHLDILQISGRSAHYLCKKMVDGIDKAHGIDRLRNSLNLTLRGFDAYTDAFPRRDLDSEPRSQRASERRTSLLKTAYKTYHSLPVKVEEWENVLQLQDVLHQYYFGQVKEWMAKEDPVIVSETISNIWRTRGNFLEKNSALENVISWQALAGESDGALLPILWHGVMKARGEIVHEWYDAYRRRIQSNPRRASIALEHLAAVPRLRDEDEVTRRFRAVTLFLDGKTEDFWLSTEVLSNPNTPEELKPGLDGIASLMEKSYHQIGKRSAPSRACEEVSRQIIGDLLLQNTESSLRMMRLLSDYVPRAAKQAARGGNPTLEYMRALRSFAQSFSDLVNLPEERAREVLGLTSALRSKDTEQLSRDMVRSVHDRSGSAKLDSVRRKLEYYANMLAGTDGGISIQQGDIIAAEFNPERRTTLISLPKSMGHFSAVGDNERLYKAFTAMFAGHLRYATGYDKEHVYIPVLEVAAQKDNPELFLLVLEVLEESRIRSRLEEEYPGSRQDIELLCQYLLQRSETRRADLSIRSGDLSSLIERSLKKDQVPDRVGKAIERATHRGAIFADALEAATEYYEKINPSDRRLVDEKELRGLTVGGYASIDKIISAMERIAREIPQGRKFRYPEFDEKTGLVIPQATIVTETPVPMIEYTPELTVAIDPRMLDVMMQQFELLAPEEITRLREQTRGRLSLRDHARWFAHKAAGSASCYPKFYTEKRYSTRDVAVAVAIELSGSTRDFLGRSEFKVDYMRIIADHLVRCIQTLGDDVALFAYNGRGSDTIRCTPILSFGQMYDENARRALLAVDPRDNNRDGAVIRHVGEYHLAEHPAHTRMLINITDGVPHDLGYDNGYGLADIRHACKKLLDRQVYAMRLVIDPKLTGEKASAMQDEFTTVLHDFKRAIYEIPWIYFQKTR